MIYVYDDLPAPTGIFKQIQVDGNIDSKEMYRTFNMGLGFCVVAPKAGTMILLVFLKRIRSAVTLWAKERKGRVRLLLE